MYHPVIEGECDSGEGDSSDGDSSDGYTCQP